MVFLTKVQFYLFSITSLNFHANWSKVIAVCFEVNLSKKEMEYNLNSLLQKVTVSLAAFLEKVLPSLIDMKDLHEALKNSEEPLVPLFLGDKETSIQFVETHWHDMRTILRERS